MIQTNNQVLSASRVEKIEQFTGTLPARSLYIYLPPGYDSGQESYPVLYMHDGQNCFESYAQDSYAGTFRADEIADELITQGAVRPFIIVGVSNGQENRIAEYLPAYTTYNPKKDPQRNFTKVAIRGRANKTFYYYRDEVAPFLKQRYRIKEGREHTATCGASMGGLFSTYIAWEFPEFARHHAALSASFWITKRSNGVLATVERLEKYSQRDIRLWLDSGTQDGPGFGDDNWPGVLLARQAMLKNGYQEGKNFRYLLAEGEIHSESAWAKRLPQIFTFLFGYQQ